MRELITEVVADALRVVVVSVLEVVERAVEQVIASAMRSQLSAKDIARAKTQLARLKPDTRFLHWVQSIINENSWK